MRTPRSRPHLLRVTASAECFGGLFATLAAAGLRAGWLELRRPDLLPPTLDAAANAGAVRAVAVGGDRSVAVKRMRGAPVLRDLLREHFAGCTLVLLAGDGAPAGAPALSPDGEGWLVELPSPATTPLRLDTPGLVARLRRPRPWLATAAATAPAPPAPGA
jgi:hypothetical protein